MPYEIISLHGTALNITGGVFGRLTAIAPVGRFNRCIQWLCICECGSELVTRGSRLKEGKVSSCGCINFEFMQTLKKTHGMTSSPEFNAWQSMKKRCLNKTDSSYEGYGGRGIKVCHRWMLSFSNFLSDVGFRPSPDHSIDRIDNDGPYSPDNCRWATRIQQHNNKRNNVWLTHDDRTQTLIQWSRETGMIPETISYRLKIGWPIEKALTHPLRKMKSNVERHGTG